MAAEQHRQRDGRGRAGGEDAPVERAAFAERAAAGGTAFQIYRTDYAGQAGHTIAQWHVADIASEVRDLKAKGVAFEVYDMPGVEWDGEIATMPGLGRAAWFRDSEGNIMCVDEE